MKNISKKSLTLAAIVLSFLVAEFAFAESAISEKAAQVKTSVPAAKTTETAEDPDLKLSIEELRKKYPIDWLEKKYGNQSNNFCSEEGSFTAVAKWPCGPFCIKYLEDKKCPNRCYAYEKGVNANLPQNLVCTFFEGTSAKDELGHQAIVDVPLAKFNDFSINEIKSAFINYNNLAENRSSDSRVMEVVAITFIYFVNKPVRSLNKDEALLRSFIFSRKINDSFVKNEENCHLFAKYHIGPSITLSKQKSFCSLFHLNKN